MTTKGAFLAAAALGFLSAMSPKAMAGDAPKDGGDKVTCDGINGCKGQGSCAGAGHGCSGQNGCKGQGHSKVTKKECTDKGGKIVADAKAPDDKAKAPADKK